MAVTYVNFAPSTSAPFSFQAQLGASQYVVTVTWNVTGQRYYVTVADLSGNVVLYAPLIASGPQLNASFEWENDAAVVATNGPHNVPLGSVVGVYVLGTGTGFDGAYEALATGPEALWYPLAANPGGTQPMSGAVCINRYNLVATVLAAPAYLSFNYATQQFEYD